MISYRLFENMQDVVLVLDKDKNLLYANPAAATMLEVTARRLCSGRPLQNWVQFAPEAFPQTREEMLQVDEPTPIRELHYQSTSGREGWIQISFQAVDGKLLVLPGRDLAASQGSNGEGIDPILWVAYGRDVTLEKTLYDKFKAQLDQKEAVIVELQKARDQLEDYSKNLERMVSERTAELHEAHRRLKTVLDSLSQAIMVFDHQGEILPFYSKVTEKFFTGAPTGKNFVDIINVKETDKVVYQQWISAIFAELLDFDDLAPLGPSDMTNNEQKYLVFEYFPMRGEAGDLQGVVVTAADHTEEQKAKREAEHERSYATRIVRIVQHRRQFELFVSESLGLIDQLRSSLQTKTLSTLVPPELREDWARALHTIKGGAASFALLEMSHGAHECETRLLNMDGSEESRLNLLQGVELMAHELEQFIQSHRFLLGADLTQKGRTVELPLTQLTEWYKKLDQNPDAFQVQHDILNNYIYEPIEKSFGVITQSLPDVAEGLGKKIKDVQFIGGEYMILPEAYEELFASLVHAFRNAVDHGIELPEVRSAQGKDPAGLIEVSFQLQERQSTRWIQIEIKDDGGGIDPAKIRERLQSKNLLHDPLASDEEIIQAVFRDDFSTRDEVSATSGRGVGLAAVKAAARKMGGAVVVKSELGHGSVLRVLVPERSYAQLQEMTMRWGKEKPIAFSSKAL